MANVNFIELYKDLDSALSQRTSPNTQFHRHNGIQLLPNDEMPYVQSTNNTDGIELEDWTVEVVSLCGSRREDVTNNFVVERSYFDNNGTPQIEWSLTNVPFDFGSRFVYLEINQMVGEVFYSNVFQLTNLRKEEVTRVDYRTREINRMHSVCLQMYFWQDLKNQEVTTYYETSTKNTVTALVKSQKHERWQTKVIPNSLWLKITDLYENKFVYTNLVRSYLFDGLEFQEFNGGENFKQNTFKLAFNPNDVYDPLYTPPIVTQVPTIVLNSVTTNGFTAFYTFDKIDFIPTYLIYEYSSDTTTWTSQSKSPDSPNSLPFNGTGTWHFRVKHPEAISNIITLNLGDTVVANNDTAQTQKGTIVEIPVLLNDVLVGETTIISVTTPTNGIAMIIDGGTKIAYSHNDSSTTFDTFDYTISNGITSSTASVGVTILAISGTSQSLFMSANGEKFKNDACLFELDAVRYYNSDFDLSVGNYIYSDEFMNVPFNGRNVYFAIQGGKAIKIDGSGKITDVLFC